MRQTNASIIGRKLPVNGGMSVIASVFDGSDLTLECRFVRDMSAEFAHEDTELNFSHVKPASVLGGVMENQASQDTIGLGGGKGLVQRSGLMSIQIVHDHIDPFRIRKGHIGQPTHLVGKVVHGALVGHCDVPPGSQRGEEHKQVTSSPASILVVHSPNLARSGCYLGLLNQLLAALVEAYLGVFWVIRRLINIQNVLHSSHKLRAHLWNAPGLCLPGFQDSFFKVLRTVSCEMLSTT